MAFRLIKNFWISGEAISINLNKIGYLVYLDILPEIFLSEKLNAEDIARSKVLSHEGLSLGHKSPHLSSTLS